MTNRLAVFDCDGTLVDSQANICRAMEATFVAHRLDPPDRGDIRRIVGLSLVPAIARLLPEGGDDLHEAMAAEYKRAFFAMRASNALDPEPLYDGISETIAALDDAGWLLGVATGKSDRGLGLILEHHGIRQRFVTLQTADRHPSKPHPAMLERAIAEAGATPRTTAMIGDTSFDMAMARAAGTHALGVLWGYHTSEELLGAGAHHVADHASQIFAHLESL
ncbi:MAG: HAD-IA family hydrolase [Sphingomonas sp.]|uniref:HAD-IA family hydrolase n=1 Tax=unclassified Sphingomonas TaxID=196159 RepID=UPI002455B21A|nr:MULTISPECIES: HAD-IA family hydrolase [unclassified Sphingomonas]MBQ1500201.1 HAD-IA family hydrolase [Sphingomonas sp.]MDH4744066.1 HAD-IA family hydrolase [Sphingomonas sp. CBMAI 2297]